VKRRSTRTRVCFVTGTRAEFGLMRSTLRAIAARRELQLQILVTGMHLSKTHGHSIDQIRKDDWTIDAKVPWRGSQGASTGNAIAAISTTLDKLQSDVVLVVGDRVEAFAGATAGHLSRRIVAHVHGGDRAEGQVDDSLRHAITKLAHVHFPATNQSAERIAKLGEDRWRIHQVGSPGLDDIRTSGTPSRDLVSRYPGISRHQFALLVLHPTDATGSTEYARAARVLDAVRRAGLAQIVTIYPNSDPGGDQIIRCWQDRSRDMTHLLSDVPRADFIGLMRDCAVMVGNSSAGVIEAGALGTPVVNVGDRQRGRERGKSVIDVKDTVADISRAVRKIVTGGRDGRTDKTHPYGGGGRGGSAGRRIAGVLARITPNSEKMLRKLIAY
jgi:GDP/UDP-N,N'-diacetylbacillosamine 2-epimerase (hydrolysing)